MVLRRFRIPAYGTTFLGRQINEPLVSDETTGVPVPILCDGVAISPGPGGI